VVDVLVYVPIPWLLTNSPVEGALMVGMGGLLDAEKSATQLKTGYQITDSQSQLVKQNENEEGKRSTTAAAFPPQGMEQPRVSQLILAMSLCTAL
jgi:hypothetical protein